MRNVGKGASVDDGGGVFHRLHEVGLDRILEQERERAGRAEHIGGHGGALLRIGHDHAGKALL